MRRCSGCHQSVYCSRECQVAHWDVHQKDCVDSSSEEEVVIEYMTMSQARKLKPSDWIDLRDRDGRFVEAQIVEKRCTKLKIRYATFGDCVVSDYADELEKFAKHHAVSGSNQHTFASLAIGDCLDVRPRINGPWTVGEIIRVERGQIKCCYYDANTGYHLCWWVHGDNNTEVQALQSQQVRAAPLLRYDELQEDEREALCLYHKEENQAQQLTEAAMNEPDPVQQELRHRRGGALELEN